MSPDIEQATRSAANRHGLPGHMVLAVVEVESSGDPWKWNPEPHYRYLVNVRTGAPFRRLTADEIRSQIPPADFPHTAGEDKDAEWWGQQASWGLMQVMGAVARELGFTGSFTRLCDVSTGLEYGCRMLARLRARHYARHGWAGVLAAYNTGQPHHSAGPGQIYVGKVANRGGLDFV